MRWVGVIVYFASGRIYGDTVERNRDAGRVFVWVGSSFSIDFVVVDVFDEHDEKNESMDASSVEN